jgi:hypothetical protein
MTVTTRSIILRACFYFADALHTVAEDSEGCVWIGVPMQGIRSAFNSITCGGEQLGMFTMFGC